MSYSLVSAIGKPVSGGGRWVEVDISNMSFVDIFQNYLRVIATLSNPFDAANTALELADIEYSITDPSVTFNAYLQSIGNASLPTSTTLPVLNTVYAKYNDAIMAGYAITPININAAIDSPLPAADKPSLKLTDFTSTLVPESLPIDFNLFGKSCMVSVNGYWHYMAADSSGAYIRDGMTSVTKSGRNTLGIWSLANLGSLTYLDITPDMVYTQNANTPLKNAVYIDLGVDLSDKTILLVIGGYLSVLDSNTFTRIGDQIIKIDWNNFPYINRYFEQLDTIDLSSLNLTVNPDNDTQAAMSELMSDAAIRAYCSLSQSFVVLLDNTEVFVDYQDVASMGTLGMYVNYAEQPNYPMVTGHGKVSEWWAVPEGGEQWGVTITDGRLDRRTFNTAPTKELLSVAANRIPARPWRISPAQFLKLGTDVNFTT